MAKHCFGSFVVCPYYKDEDGQKVRCEGVGQGSVIHLAFSTKEEKKQYKIAYCEKDWRMCMIASALNKKYQY